MLTVFLIAVLPVFVLALMVYARDKEKEPFRTLRRAFLGGVLSVPLVLAFHYLMAYLGIDLETNVVRRAFVSAGTVEESAKLLMFMLFIWAHPDFDEPFDGIVYAAYVSLGFACVENLMYVFSSDDMLGTGIMRGLLAVPAHFLFGVIQGYNLARAKFGRHPALAPIVILFGLALAILAHGIYDYLLMVNSDMSAPQGMSVGIMLLFYLFDFMLWKVGLKRMRKLESQSDEFRSRWPNSRQNIYRDEDFTDYEEVN